MIGKAASGVAADLADVAVKPDMADMDDFRMLLHMPSAILRLSVEPFWAVEPCLYTRFSCSAPLSVV